MTKEELLQGLASSCEQLIETAREADSRGVARQSDGWGPREVLAHVAGWEMMATVRVPRIAAGMAPLEESDEERQAVMDEAINTSFVALIGEQSLEAVCGILRRAYQRDLEMLRKLEDRFFHPGDYVYERTAGVIEHCQEHMEGIVHMQAAS